MVHSTPAVSPLPPGGAAAYGVAQGVSISLFGRGGQEVFKGATFKHGAFIHLSSLVQSQ
jgi:uncharacterized membrane protein YjjB (DUF3815 family)